MLTGWGEKQQLARQRSELLSLNQRGFRVVAWLSDCVCVAADDLLKMAEQVKRQKGELREKKMEEFYFLYTEH